MQYLQSRDDLLADLLDRNSVPPHVRVDDVRLLLLLHLLLPTHHDGLLTVGLAAHLDLLTLGGQRVVGVRRDHGWY